MPAKKYQVALGCGLIGIGRPWGFVPSVVPTEAEAFSFLEHAFQAWDSLFRYSSFLCAQ